MNIVVEATRKLEEQLRESGCEDGIVRIETLPGCTLCQYEKGACMNASFGGRSAEFVTFDPVRATTRISFMFGATLEKTTQRIAACAIINVITGFLCLSRKLHACAPEHHGRCATELRERCKGLRIYNIGEIYHKEVLDGLSFVQDPEMADLFLVTGEGLVSPDGLGHVSRYRGKKPMIFVAPSTAGICSVLDLDHWCPYGGVEIAERGGT
jgi:hypothetical protein